MTGHGRAKNMDISDYFLGWNVEITQIPLITIMTIIVDGMFRYVPVLVIWESMVLTLKGLRVRFMELENTHFHGIVRRMDEGNYTRIPGISTKIWLFGWILLSGLSQSAADEDVGPLTRFLPGWDMRVA